MVVHAHPDDESLTTGGTLARYASEGAHVCLVCCTNGELGEIADLPDTDPQAVAPLGEVRAAELYEACRALGLRDVRMLGYRDSGMAGTPSVDDPDAFVNQADVADKIEAVLREVRPQVVVTYDERGLYGHPDHVHAHRATRAANARLERPATIWYPAYSRSRLERAGMLALVALDDHCIDARLDVSPYEERVVAALRAHRTQWGTTKDVLSLPGDARHALLGTEEFVRADGAVEPPVGDLFDADESGP